MDYREEERRELYEYDPKKEYCCWNWQYHLTHDTSKAWPKLDEEVRKLIREQIERCMSTMEGL